MKKLLLLALLLPTFAFSQKKYSSEMSLLTFFSDGIIEDIQAKNTRVTSIMDVVKGEMAFLVRIKEFQFEKKLMQTHFNEKFMESEKYPKATFLGTFKGFDPSKSGSQPVTAKGKLFIHGIYRDVTVPGTMEVKGNSIVVKAAFKVRLEDYNIAIPQILFKNIAEEVDVKLNITYTAL
jgi:polyisoprenoid-binding protein YceI